ncbi:MAG: hypothetical protein EXS31_07075 [Pedosphaera sp.]|nr:hypothetical protein [Pedosphaera sp.]
MNRLFRTHEFYFTEQGLETKITSSFAVAWHHGKISEPTLAAIHCFPEPPQSFIQFSGAECRCRHVSYRDRLNHCRQSV